MEDNPSIVIPLYPVRPNEELATRKQRLAAHHIKIIDYTEIRTSITLLD